MSTELYLTCCDHCDDPQCVHIGTRYVSGVKLLTIGPSKERVEAWLTRHVFCELAVTDEHQVAQRGYTKEGEE